MTNARSLLLTTAAIGICLFLPAGPALPQGDERNDRGYRIARVEKGEGGRWTIVSVFSVRDRQLEFPISASVKFAGDTAVLILDDVKAGPGKANWSARILFHDDVYTGRWWETSNKEHGGTIAGTIERSE